MFRRMNPEHRVSMSEWGKYNHSSECFLSSVGRTVDS